MLWFVLRLKLNDILSSGCYNHAGRGFYVSNNCLEENITSGRSSYTSSTISDISNCYFVRLSSYSGNGGVIYFTTSGFSMSIKSSMFYYCRVSGSYYGGAIYFSSSTCNMSHICASYCHSPGAANFAWIQVSSGSTMSLMSVTRCSDITQSYYPIRLQSGSQIMHSSNLSLNNAYQASGIRLYNTDSFFGAYCTFAHNIASYSTCIDWIGKKGEISYSNIVNNVTPARNGIITITDSAQGTISWCVLIGNSHILFYLASGSLTVSNSYIPSDECITSGSVSIISSAQTMSTHVISYFSSYHCHADLSNHEMESKFIRIKGFGTLYISVIVFLL